MRQDGELAKKTVRFAEIVKEAGNPEQYTLWRAPERDPGFKRALRENRVMTLVQAFGSKPDYGLVGYEKLPQASHLIFPKSLAKFAGKKVVGIKYELLASPKPLGPAVKPEQLKPKVVQPSPAKTFEPKVLPKPEVVENEARVSHPATGLSRLPEQKAPKRFLVTLTAVAQMEMEEEVEAINQAEAKQFAAKKVRESKPDFSKAEVKIRIRKAKALAS